jgi:cell wall-associated NlpC family hydrolase/uncharacterized protein YgiM (DUF1202 family)
MTRRVLVAIIAVLAIIAAYAAYADTQAVYVKAKSVPVYASASTSAKKLGTMQFGDRMEYLAHKSGWVKVQNARGEIGFCKQSALATDNPVGSPETHYAKSDGVKAHRRTSTATSAAKTYQAGDAVEVVATTSDGKWHRVVIGDGHGFVEGKDLVKQAPKEKVQDAPREAPREKIDVYIASNQATVYRTNSTSSKKLGDVCFGEKFVQVDQSGNWSMIERADGGLGWLRTSDITTDNPNGDGATLHAKSGGTRIYARPKTNAKSLGTLKKGDGISVIATTSDGKWHRVSAGGKYGYVQTSKLEERKTVEKVDVYIASNQATVYRTNSTSSKKLGDVCFGEKFVRVDQSGNWSMIERADGGLGWLRTSDITTENPNGDGATLHAKSGGTRIYARPKTNAKSLGTLKQGDGISVIATTSDGKWHRVNAGGKYGYVQASKLEERKAQEKVDVYIADNQATVYQSDSSSSKRMGDVSFGEKFVMVDQSGSWAKIQRSDGGVGWLRASCVTTQNPNGDAVKHYACADGAGVYARPLSDARKLDALDKGESIGIVAATGDGKWLRAKTDGGYGYIRADDMTKDKPQDEPEEAPSGYRDTRKGTGGATAEKVAAIAVAQYGKKYVYATRGPDTYDCSGLMVYSFSQGAGISLSRSAYAQGYDTRFKRITDVSALRRGDIVCFDTVEGDVDLSDHTGLYLGGGAFIHASSSAGEVVVSTLDSGYYSRKFSWGLRVLD